MSIGSCTIQFPVVIKICNVPRGGAGSKIFDKLFPNSPSERFDEISKATGHPAVIETKLIMEQAQMSADEGSR